LKQAVREGGTEIYYRYKIIQLEVDFIYVRLTSTTDIHVYRSGYCLLTYFFRR